VRGFGRYEFELMLLRRMADFQPGLVTSALEQLGAGRADLAWEVVTDGGPP
jgi:hypothetical protein